MLSKVGNLYCLMACVMLVFASSMGTALAEQPDPNYWLTGNAFDQKMLSEVSIRWSGQQLRTALNHLAEAQKVAIFLDRRIDPSQQLDVTLNEVMLLQGIMAIAESNELGVSLADSVFYFGPKEAAGDLLTLIAMAREEVEKVPAKQRGVLLKPQTLQWPELARPKDIIAQTVEHAGVKLVGLERVPHDLWPAGSWPAMSLIERLSLLAIGFDLQVRVSPDGTAVALVPRVKPARLVREYEVGTRGEQIQADLAQRIPDAECKLSAEKLFVKGKIEDHELIQAVLRGQPPPVKVPAGKASSETPAGTKVYTLTVENKPLVPVLKALCKQLEVELTLDEEELKAAGVNPSALVTFSVKEATAGQLWDAVLAPAKLSYELRGNELKVFPQAYK